MMYDMDYAIYQYINAQAEQYVEFESPLPDYFTALLNKLRQTSGNK